MSNFEAASSPLWKAIFRWESRGDSGRSAEYLAVNKAVQQLIDEARAEKEVAAAGHGGCAPEYDTLAEETACNRIVDLEDQVADLIRIVKALTVK